MKQERNISYTRVNSSYDEEVTRDLFLDSFSDIFAIFYRQRLALIFDLLPRKVQKQSRQQKAKWNYCPFLDKIEVYSDKYNYIVNNIGDDKIITKKNIIKEKK